MAQITAIDGSAPAANHDDHSNVTAHHHNHNGVSPTQRKHEHSSQPSRDNCDRRRPEEDEHSRLKKMPTALAGKTVSPFLKQHIPGLYAPVGKEIHDESSDPAAMSGSKDPNTRFCYRHSPDSKCRRTADEKKMGVIQTVRRFFAKTFLLGSTSLTASLGTEQPQCR